MTVPRMSNTTEAALKAGCISCVGVAFFLLPADIAWRLYLSLVGGSFIAPFALIYHLPPPAQIVHDEELPIVPPVVIETKE